MKNGRSPGGDNINSESYKCAQEEFKLRLLQFLSNIYKKKKKIVFQMNGEMPLQSQYLR
jgi:hypothetical protein